MSSLSNFTDMIWYNKDITIDGLAALGENTMAEFLGIHFTAIGENSLEAAMPVTNRTIQPYGLLHGGASCALAETIGSVASALVIDQSKQICVGLEINANHLRAVREGTVTGTAVPLHLGRSTHVWDIRLTDEKGRLFCISRLTVAILNKDSG